MIYLDETDRFLEKLKGIEDPEQKRKIIGSEFIEVFAEEARKHEGIKFLGQGTIYPDILESDGSHDGLGGQEQAGNGGGVLQSGAGHLDRIGNTGGQEVDDEPVVLGNMPVASRRESSEGMLTTFEQTPRMSTYLAAFVAGDLQRATTATKSGVEVNVYPYPPACQLCPVL